MPMPKHVIRTMIRRRKREAKAGQPPRPPRELKHPLFPMISYGHNWTLYAVPSIGTAPWSGIKLQFRPVRRRDRPKHNWWLNWNGERLARNRDASLLEQYNPEIYAWILGSLGQSR